MLVRSDKAWCRLYSNVNLGRNWDMGQMWRIPRGERIVAKSCPKTIVPLQKEFVKNSKYNC